MEIKHIISIDSGYKDTIPLFIDKDNNRIRILHGNKEFIRISEFKDNKLEEISTIQLKSLKNIYSILFDDLDDDGNKELLYFNEKDETKFFRFENNKFNPLESQDFSHELKKLSDKENIQIKLLKKLNKRLIAIGTSYGLLFCTIDKNLKIKCKESIKEKTIWECVLSNFSDLNKNYFFIGTDDKILILNNSFKNILEIKTNERIYCINLYDFDRCGKKEIICGTKKGNIIIYKIDIEEDSKIKYTEYLKKQIISEYECGREKPAINTILLEDLNRNDKVNIILGGNDFKVKILEWDFFKRDLHKVFVCELPREQVYSIKIFDDFYKNLCLLYSTYVEEISYNHLIIYHNAQSDFTKIVIKSLAERLKNDPKEYCFFLGAGFSFYEDDPNKSCPLAKTLIRELFQKYNISEEKLPFSKYKDSLEYVFLFLKKLYPDENFNNFIMEKFQKEFNIPRSVKFFTQLVKQKVISQIFTVNWDLLIEKQLKSQINTYYKTFNFNDIKFPFYVKLHGTSSDIDSIITSIDEIELNEYNFSLVFKRNLLKLFYDSKTFIFVGYSFNDLDFIDIFKYKLYNDRINIYIFDPNPNKMMYKIINNRIKMYQEEKFHFHIFKCKADEFFEELFKNIL